VELNRANFGDVALGIKGYHDSDCPGDDCPAKLENILKDLERRDGGVFALRGETTPISVERHLWWKGECLFCQQEKLLQLSWQEDKLPPCE
jgi:hypothetical protein